MIQSRPCLLYTSKVSIQNSVAEITFTTKGGRVYSAMLKEYKGQDKTNPVVLFDGDDATMSFNFYNKQGAIQTKDYYCLLYTSRCV